jgi:predicted  nucleic acid-binding Zn-ribbon protein
MYELECKECGYAFEDATGQWVYECPECGSRRVRLVACDEEDVVSAMDDFDFVSFAF